MNSFEASDQMTDHDVNAADRLLLRKELHTMRERTHLVERRLHDIEMALNIIAIRADGHAEELTVLRSEVSECRAEQRALTVIVANVIERMEALLSP